MERLFIRSSSRHSASVITASQVQMVSSCLEFLEPKNSCLRQMDRFVSRLIGYMQTSTIPQLSKRFENVGLSDFDKSSADLQTFADESCRALVKRVKTYHPVIRRIWEMIPHQMDGLTPY